VKFPLIGTGGRWPAWRHSRPSAGRRKERRRKGLYRAQAPQVSAAAHAGFYGPVRRNCGRAEPARTAARKGGAWRDTTVAKILRRSAGGVANGEAEGDKDMARKEEETVTV
jgi:hypothetical protein